MSIGKDIVCIDFISSGRRVVIGVGVIVAVIGVVVDVVVVVVIIEIVERISADVYGKRRRRG